MKSQENLMERFQSYRHERLRRQWEQAIQFLFRDVDPPFRADWDGRAKVPPCPHMGFWLEEKGLLFTIELDVNETLLHRGGPKFRLIVYRPQAEQEESIIVFESGDFQNEAGLAWEKDNIERIAKGYARSWEILPALAKALQDQRKKVGTPDVYSALSHLPKDFSKNWIAQRDSRQEL